MNAIYELPPHTSWDAVSTAFAKPASSWPLRTVLRRDPSSNRRRRYTETPECGLQTGHPRKRVGDHTRRPKRRCPLCLIKPGAIR